MTRSIIHMVVNQLTETEDSMVDFVEISRRRRYW